MTQAKKNSIIPEAHCERNGVILRIKRSFISIMKVLEEKKGRLEDELFKIRHEEPFDSREVEEYVEVAKFLDKKNLLAPGGPAAAAVKWLRADVAHRKAVLSKKIFEMKALISALRKVRCLACDGAGHLQDEKFRKWSPCDECKQSGLSTRMRRMSRSA